MILDEIFQGQDAITAERLRAHLREWGQGRTLIYITHSLQHLQELDCVYVLQHGDIVEQGTAEALLQQKEQIAAPAIVAFLCSGNRPAADFPAQLQ